MDSIAPIWQALETICYISTPLVRSLMGDSMCWEIDYKFFANQKKAQKLGSSKNAVRASSIGS